MLCDFYSQIHCWFIFFWSLNNTEQCFLYNLSFLLYCFLAIKQSLVNHSIDFLRHFIAIWLVIFVQKVSLSEFKSKFDIYTPFHPCLHYLHLYLISRYMFNSLRFSSSILLQNAEAQLLSHLLIFFCTDITNSCFIFIRHPGGMTRLK
jgi:hypothetical protein